jgi:hypothetical protein
MRRRLMRERATNPKRFPRQVDFSASRFTPDAVEWREPAMRSPPGQNFRSWRQASPSPGRGFET